MAYTWNFGFLAKYESIIISGLLVTIQLSLVILAFSAVFGLVVAAARLSSIKPLRYIAYAYVEFFRNIPPLVQIFWWYYTLPVLTGGQVSPFTAASLALSGYGIAFFSEIYRSGIESIERGQWEASRALGMRYGGQMRYVVLPQAVRRMIPAFVNQVIETIKQTTIASTIAVPELMRNARLISSTEFRPLEAYTATGLVYVVLIMCLSFLANYLERRVSLKGQ